MKTNTQTVYTFERSLKDESRKCRGLLLKSFSPDTLLRRSKGLFNISWLFPSGKAGPGHQIVQHSRYAIAQIFYEISYFSKVIGSFYYTLNNRQNKLAFQSWLTDHQFVPVILAEAKGPIRKASKSPQQLMVLLGEIGHDLWAPVQTLTHTQIWGSGPRPGIQCSDEDAVNCMHVPCVKWY